MVGIAPSDTGYTLTIDDGSAIQASRIVLATGPPPPLDVRLRDGGWPPGHPAYVPNPWAPRALDAIPAEGDVLLVGTGPTTIDVALELAETRPGVRMTAVSRHGLLPTVHRRSGTQEVSYRPLPPGATLCEQLRAFRVALPQAGEERADARDMVDAMRPHTQDALEGRLAARSGAIPGVADARLDGESAAACHRWSRSGSTRSATATGW